MFGKCMNSILIVVGSFMNNYFHLQGFRLLKENILSDIPIRLKPSPIVNELFRYEVDFSTRDNCDCYLFQKRLTT